MADAAAPAPAQGGGESKIAGLMPVIFLALNCIVMGVLLMPIYKVTLGHKFKETREPAALEELQKDRLAGLEEESVLYTPESFTVNLAGNPRRIIRVQMSLEMLDKEGFEEVVRLGPEARDEIVKLLGSKEFKDVESIQGKLFLKDQITVALNHFMKKGVVKDVYFSEFIVQ